MKIAIVNDSVMATEVLRRIVSTKNYEVLWCAKNGAEAIMNCHHSIPDLILMDLMMPVMDGVEATRRIMRSTPCPILVVTSTVSGHSSEVFRAMGAGALDVVATPVTGANPDNDMGQDLLKKIALIRRLKGPTGPQQPTFTAKKLPVTTKQTNNDYLITLGCSTGGPQAILEILSSFPANLNAAIVVIQHMDKQFTPGLVSWLGKQLTIPVHLIEEGDCLKKGVVMLPSTNNHIIMTPKKTLHYSPEPLDNFYHPSIDVFFESTVLHWHGPIIAALLTGMGRDGARGLLSIKKQGGTTISQDKKTSVVYGMPKAAIELNAATTVLPLHEIGKHILNLLPS